MRAARSAPCRGGRGEHAGAEQPRVEEVGGARTEVGYEAPVRGPGGRRSAASPVLGPEVPAERGPQLLGPLHQSLAARPAVRVEQIGAQQCRAVGVRLRLAAERTAGVRVGQIDAVTDGGTQPCEAPLGRGQQFLGLLLRKSPAPGLREQYREQQGRLGGRAARRQVRAGVPARAGDQAGLRSGSRDLAAGEGTQRARGEPGAEWQCHPGRDQCLGRRQAASPRRPRREVRVRRVGGIAQQ